MNMNSSKSPMELHRITKKMFQPVSMILYYNIYIDIILYI